jgi:hypothetical protein
LFFAFAIELDCKVMKLFFHVPRNLLWRYFLNVFHSEKIERKYLLSGFGVFIFGLELFEKTFIRIYFVEVFVIFQGRLSDSEKLASVGRNTWVINGFSFIGLAVSKGIKIDKFDFFKLSVLIRLLFFIIILFLFPDCIFHTVLILNVTVNKSQSCIDLIHLRISVLCDDFSVLLTAVIGR